MSSVAPRIQRYLLAAVALPFLCVMASVSPPAKAAACDTIRTASGTELVFFKQNMKCSTAKLYAHRLMRDGSYDARNFDCKRHSPTEGGCTHEVRPRKFFIFYPEH